MALEEPTSSGSFSLSAELEAALCSPPPSPTANEAEQQSTLGGPEAEPQPAAPTRCAQARAPSHPALQHGKAPTAEAPTAAHVQQFKRARLRSAIPPPVARPQPEAASARDTVTASVLAVPNKPSGTSESAAPAAGSRVQPTAAACTHPVMVGNLCAICAKVIQGVVTVGEQRGSTKPATAEAQYEIKARAMDPQAAARHAKREAKRKAFPGLNALIDGATGEAAASHLALSYLGGGLRVSNENAVRASARAKAALLHSQRLILVLDLDHTLLNSIASSQLRPEDVTALEHAWQAHGASPERADNTLFHLPHRSLWTKLRPGAREMLTDLERVYDLHIYTMGDRVYAHEMASLLDVSGRLFKNKIVSRDDSSVETVKDLKLLLGAEDMALVVDDTLEVWADCAENIIHVDRYHFFPHAPEGSEAQTRSFLRTGNDERAEGGQLETVQRVLRDAHAHFYPGSSAAATAVGSSAAATASGPSAAGSSAAGSSAAGSRPAAAAGSSAAGSNAADAAAAAAGSSAAAAAASGPSAAASGSNATASGSNAAVAAAAAAGSSAAGSSAAGSSGAAAAGSSAVLAAAAAALPANADAAHPDVRQILTSLRRQVLHGCHLAFSKVIPLELQQQDASRHPLWRLALSLGAQVTNDIVPETTHLVTMSYHTSKVKRAAEAGVAVVRPAWLRHCSFRWTNLPGADYPAPDDKDGLRLASQRRANRTQRKPPTADAAPPETLSEAAP